MPRDLRMSRMLHVLIHMDRHVARAHLRTDLEDDCDEPGRGAPDDGRIAGKGRGDIGKRAMAAAGSWRGR